MKYLKLSVVLITVGVSLYIWYNNLYKNRPIESAKISNSLSKNIDNENLDENKFSYLSLFKCKNMQDLIEVYGKAFVKDKGVAMTIEDQEISGSKHLLLYSNTINEVDIVFYKEGISQYTFEKMNSKWVLPLNIHLGASLQELERINDAPISFYGLGWDYGGMIESWNNGKLSKVNKIKIAGSLGDNSASSNDDTRIIGDSVFRSDMAIAKETNLSLVSVVLSLNEQSN